MKLEKEKLLNTTYDKFLQTSLLDFPLEQIDELIDQNVMGFGTAVNEKIHSISDYRKMIERQREQAKGIMIHIVNNPALRKMLADGNLATYVDEVNIVMTVNDESHELFLRISTLLEYQKEKWIVLHFHRSKPEYVEGEKDTWHINELNKKNEELEKKVEEKTADLEIKNKELKIEASLERIRTVAMSMQNSEGLLDVVEIINGELKTLGFTDIRNTIINIFNDTKEIFLNYDYSDYGVGGISEVDYNSHPINTKFVNKMREASTDFMITEFTGNELDEWRKWR
ncbi:MAG: nuclear transport factor 2 family protein, partial [Melioribacteraceae bacterium]|nr:nuclear transport factor 2 family protein [Melioribacteraceae bacterium]